MRSVLIGLVAAAGLLGVAETASAQRFKQIEFQEFLVNDREYHGKLVSLHALYLSDEAVYSDGTFGADYFKGNGVTGKKYFRFSVTWRAQTREWLYPCIEKKAGGAATMWSVVQRLKKGDKFTLFGKLKRLGDTGERGMPSDPTRTSRTSSAYAEVPSIMKVMKVKLGWVKTLGEYIQDLGGDDPLVDETIVMLRREGSGVLGMLTRVAGSSRFSETQRANACKAVAAFGKASYASKLATVIKKTDSERIRTAAILAMGELKVAEAVKILHKLMTQKEPDEWAPYGVAELFVAKLVNTRTLKETFGREWNKRKDGIIEALMDIAQTAFERKQFERSERFCSFTIDLQDGNGAAFHLRGKARSALAERKPEMRRLAKKDFTRAVELGEEDPDLFLHHARALLKAGDKKGAKRYAELVLEERPKNAEARRIKALAEGKSAAMIDGRVCRMYGAAIRVPAKWEDLEAYVGLKRGEVLRVRGFPEGRKQGSPQVGVVMWSQDAPEIGALSAGMDWHSEIKRLVERQKYELVESGVAKLPKGKEGAFAVATRMLQGEELKCLWALVQHNNKLLTVLITCPAKIFDTHRSTFDEMYKTAAWEGEKSKE